MSSNQALGLLVGTTVIIALLADLLFLPPLLMVLDGFGLRKKRQESGEGGGQSENDRSLQA